jgi:hypothetical protein
MLEVHQPVTLDFGAYGSSQNAFTGVTAEVADDFNDFEEDEMTKRIREEEERVQQRLREKSVLECKCSNTNTKRRGIVESWVESNMNNFC